MVEARRIELRSKALPWQVSPGSVAVGVSGVSHTVTRARRPSRFRLSSQHTDYVCERISLK